MSKLKPKILSQALNLFNELGVSDVSIRQIAKATGISHGNLIYHYKSKSEIIRGLHDQLLAQAVSINQDIDRENFDITQLYQITFQGFEVAYNFRFLFYDLLYICNQDPKMRSILIEVEKVRSKMYWEVLRLSIKNGFIREEAFEGEYDQLIHRIKIFSDHWLSSAAIYENKEQDQIIKEYAQLFMSHFYPYLTEKGKQRPIG